jgi:DNA-binding CsgD family transcriptional regulator
MAVLAAADVATDLRSGTTLRHVLVEGTLLIVAAAGAGLIARKLSRTAQEVREARAAARSLEGRLATSTADAVRWRQEARSLLAGLGEAIDAQFDRWALSAAEREVALLLLKGLSHKEIAEVRSVSEATARQQARAVYRKAGLSGRHDLAAFFLEDLMVPTETTGGHAGEPR